MYLIEIYKSVQGESSFAGLPCIFVRLAGCNLRCTWCDSEYTFKGGYKQSPEEVEEAITKLAPVKLVEFTGGEPMLQAKELLPLMVRLLEVGYHLMIETSGERPLADIPKAVHKIMDVKCPGSGESEHFHLPNLEALTALDEVKFVIADRRDYEFARNFTREHGLAGRVKDVLFSPAFNNRPSLERDASNCTLDPRLLVDWMLADGVPARLNLQIHKFVWEPAMKGV